MGWMFKFLVFGVAFVVLSYWVRSLFFGRLPQNKAPDEQQRTSRQREVPSKQTITCCKYCGVFVPETDLVYGKLGGYCSKEHQLRDEKTSSK